ACPHRGCAACPCPAWSGRNPCPVVSRRQEDAEQKEPGRGDRLRPGLAPAARDWFSHGLTSWKSAPLHRQFVLNSGGNRRFSSVGGGWQFSSRCNSSRMRGSTLVS